MTRSIESGALPGAELAPSPKMAAALGWPELLEKLAALCHTARGQERARSLPLLPTAEAVEEELDLVAEARALHDRGEPLPFGEIWDLRPALRRLEKEGALEGPALLQLAQTLLAGARLGRFLRDRRAAAPRLSALGGRIAALDGVSGPIADSFVEGGTLADHASEELGRLRRKLAELHERLVKRMRGLMEAPHIAKHLQDTFYTQREDRYVLPIRTDAGPALEGIVHGSSNSGATTFIEPREVVGLNNELKVAEIEVLREEARILAELSALVGEQQQAIAANLELLERLDTIDARARLAAALAAHRPRLSAGRVRLQAMRHPLMVLAGGSVVENNLELGARHALIVTGPNAGGKTVCLKTLGLCALMLRAGMHLPAGPDSELPCYAMVLAEMGDDQSIERSLSTFTAHLTHLLQFIDLAAPGVLVLLDEIAVGTDPEEGAALAQALLEALVETGAQIMVTTHYERLKSLPLHNDRFTNASVGFELERMAPTYRLHLGVPGSSGALAVARQVGLPPHLAERAASLLDRGAQELSTLLTALAGERSRLEEQRAALAAAEAEAIALQERQRAEIERLRDKQRAALAGEFSAALEDLKRARQELERVRALLKREPTKERLAQADRQISAAAETIRAREPREVGQEGLPAAAGDLAPGTRIFVQRLGGTGEVLEPPQRGKVTVRVGGIRTQVPLDEVRLAPAAARPREERRPKSAPEAQRREAPAAPPTAIDRMPPIRTDDITLNVRGLRVDEAEAEVDKFLDRALQSGDSVLFVIHGHGTGALRTALRSHLESSELVERIAPAGPKDGGDGVTVVWLK
jgi:DNA mismatch repair protein MutS2